MPTDNTVQTPPAGTAVSPPAGSTQPALTDEAIASLSKEKLASHPYVKDLETRYAAAHKEIDGKKTKKELEAEIARYKVLVGESSVEAPVTPAASSAAKPIDAAQIQADIEWNIANKTLIQAAGQLYADNLSKGMDKQDALELALARRPNGDKTFAEQMRAQVTASAGGGTDRTPDGAPNVPGIPKTYVEEMRRKFPDLPEANLLAIVQRAQAQKEKHGR